MRARAAQWIIPVLVAVVGCHRSSGDCVDDPDCRKSTLISSILRAYEEAGDAMRFLNADGKTAWKATPRMLTSLADAEQEARDDWED